jgi:hypothetical protein
MCIASYSEEKFSMESDMMLKDVEFDVYSLDPAKLKIYEDFVGLIGVANAIINDIPSDEEELLLHYRKKNFEHDDDFNIIGQTVYAKNYSEFSDDEKAKIDLFVSNFREYAFL